jgi:hypothetical protein
VSFLPILQRELATAARRPSTYRTRTGFVIVMSLIAATLLFIGSAGTTRSVGNAVFSILAASGFLYCLLAGARQSADCLSEEKRDGTLGLMFLTDLRGRDVVLGKFVSVSARAFQGLFAIFPVLSIGLLMGGITGGEFWRTAAVLVNALFFSVAVGLFVSSLAREAYVALTLTLLLLFVLLVAPLGAEWLLSMAWNHRDFASWPSPAAAGLLASDLHYRAEPVRFWRALAGNHALGWSFLFMASVVLPRSWQDRSVPVSPRTVPAAGVVTISCEKRTAFRRRLLEINPIYWLAARNHERERRLLHAFVPLVVALDLGILLLQPFIGGYTLGLASVLNVGVSLVLKVSVAWQACATLSEARRNGAVELLLATPLRIDEMIRGHWQALQRFFLWPATAALALPVIPALALVQPQAAWSPLFYLGPPASLIFGMATFLLDLVAIAWVGMWMGHSHTRTVQAFSKTVLFVIILPMVFFCVPSLLFDFFWIVWARRKLEQQFRAVVSEQAPGCKSADGGLIAGGPSPAPPVIRPVAGTDRGASILL